MSHRHTGSRYSNSNTIGGGILFREKELWGHRIYWLFGSVRQQATSAMISCQCYKIYEGLLRQFGHHFSQFLMLQYFNCPLCGSSLGFWWHLGVSEKVVKRKCSRYEIFMKYELRLKPDSELAGIHHSLWSAALYFRNSVFERSLCNLTDVE